MTWFSENQRSVQLYDIDHPRSCAPNLDGTAYRDHQLDLADWTIVHQAVPALAPLAFFNNLLEGTQYVTASLVLPSVNLVLMEIKDDAMVLTATCTCNLIQRRVPLPLYFSDVRE